MSVFEAKVNAVLDVMEKSARSINAKGVAVLAWLDNEKTCQWVGRMRVVDAAVAENSNEKGYNLVAVAWSKAAEMMATKQNSGTTKRDYLYGELGYQGGAIKKVGDGYLVAAFSGATSEEDFEISEEGIKAFIG